MTPKSTGLTRAALLASAFFVAGPVLAKSPAEVIADEFLEFGRAQAQGVTVGSRDVSGDTVRLTDVGYKIDNDEVLVDVTAAWIEFKDLGGDSVAISFSPMVGNLTGKKEPGGLNFTMANEGLVYIASGTPDARSYDIKAQSVSLDMELVDGPPEMEDFDIKLVMSDIDGDTLLSGGPSGKADMTMRFGSMALDYLVAADEMKADQGDIVNEETAESLFTGERAMALTMATQAYTAKGDMRTPDGQTFNLDSSAASTNSLIALGGGKIDYDVTANDVTYNIASNAMPIPPVDLSMSEFGMRFAMPMGVAGTEGPLGMRMTFRDLLVSEGVWAMVDPGQVLPRDPATLNIDVSGNAKTLVNFTNPEALAALAGRPPIEVSDVAITDVTLKVAGAELLASGAATLDNSGPIPVPDGKVTASLRGANGLIDKLMQLGLISAQEAMPARMMMGMFAVPGDGPDHLESEILFQPDGRILANGIPIR